MNKHLKILFSRVVRAGLLFFCIFSFCHANDKEALAQANIKGTSDTLFGKIHGIGSFGESIKNKIRSYFYGTPTIDGIEILKNIEDSSAIDLFCTNEFCAIDRSLAMDFGLTHLSEQTPDTQNFDSYKNLVLPWRGFCLKTASGGVSKLNKKSSPMQVIFQFGPENPSSIGNFIFSFLVNCDWSKPRKKWHSNINSVSLNTTARGFFGDQSGVLKNIELVVQLGCTYDLTNGFSRYNFQRYNVQDADKKEYLAATVGEYYFVFEGLLGLFYQHSSNRFRTGVYWTNNNLFNTSKAWHILANENKKDAPKDYQTEFYDKLNEIAKNTPKEMAFYKTLGGLCEANFFNGRFSIGGQVESSLMILPNIEEKQNKSISILSIFPYLKFAFAQKLLDSKSVLCQGVFGLKNYYTNNTQERKLLGQNISFGCQLNF